MEKKQTALQWVEAQLIKQKKVLKEHFEGGKWNDDRCSEIDNCLDIVKAAKAMEKEQIKDAYDWGETNGSDECNGDGPTHDNFDQYYTETYEQP
jgi:hypothetical protein